MVLNSKSEHLASRVVHVSVQLFSNEAIVTKALEENHLLPIILSSLYNMIVTPYSNYHGNFISNFSELLIECKVNLIFHFNRFIFSLNCTIRNQSKKTFT